MRCLVIYDIAPDGLRSKVADICEDYGLQRIQYSAFMGELNRNKQDELMQKLKRKLGRADGSIHLYPICEKDLRLCIAVGERIAP